MIVVDSEVWIDFFNGADNPARATLRRLLDAADTPLVVPDLVLYEVLRGFREEREYLHAEALMRTVEIEATGDPTLALHAAMHFRHLRAAGVTIRSAIDVLIATFCIDRNYVLLHADRDFDHFERHRGLRTWRH